MMKQIFGRTGFWWRTMGFTRCHLIGVFVTESVLGTLALASLVGAVLMATIKGDRFVAVSLFLTAICLLLTQVGVLLSSILALMFYAGSREEAGAQDAKTHSQPATPQYSEPAARSPQR
jgi:apolipoprotein N-acyltransferase